MRYIFIITLFFFIGCSNEKKNEKTQPTKPIVNQKPIKKERNYFYIQLKDLNLTFKENKLIYPKKRVYLLFYDNSNYSKMQEDALKFLKIKFYKTDNSFLKKYFNIKLYPTTIILDKNKTIKFENFTPIEILKGF